MYVKELLKKFKMEQSKAASVPLQQHVKFESDDGSKEVDVTLYKQLVGKLIYLTTTRPDLKYSVNVLSQLMTKRLENHWMAAKGVLTYRKGTIHFGIKYIDSFYVKLIGYSDLVWARNIDDIIFITRYAFNIGFEVIFWSSKKQSTISLSLKKENYQAVCAATCEEIWLRRLLEDVGEELKDAKVIKCDD